MQLEARRSSALKYSEQLQAMLEVHISTLEEGNTKSIQHKCTQFKYGLEYTCADTQEDLSKKATRANHSEHGQRTTSKVYTRKWTNDLK